MHKPSQEARRERQRFANDCAIERQPRQPQLQMRLAKFCCHCLALHSFAFQLHKYKHLFTYSVRLNGGKRQ